MSKKFFCPHVKCKDFDKNKEYGCRAKSAGSSAPYPIFCKKVKNK